MRRSVGWKDTAVKPDAAAIEWEQTRLAGEFWREWRPRDTAKHLAGALGIGVSYAKKLLDGEKPVRGSIRTRAEMIWGKEFVALMLRPYGDWTLPFRFDAQLDALGSNIARLQAEYEKLREGRAE